MTDLVDILRARIQLAELDFDYETVGDLNEIIEEIVSLKERADSARHEGFLAGVEAAYEVSGEYHQITHIREAIRALTAQKVK